MPTNASFARVPLDIEALETVPFPLDAHEEIWDAYPHPYLRQTGRQHQTSVRVARLENQFVLYEFAVDLGGRLWRIHDKRTSTEILLGPLKLAAGSRRGVAGYGGLQWWIESEPFALNLGFLDATLMEPQEDSDPAILRMHVIEPGWDISLHTVARLNPESAVLELEFKAANRAVSSARVQLGFGLVMDGDAVQIGNDFAVLGSTSGGVALIGLDTISEIREIESGVIGEFLTPSGWLGPRCGASGQIQILPFSGIPFPTAVSNQAALALGKDRLWIQSAEVLPGATVIVEDEDLQPFSLRSELNPLHIWEGKLPNLTQAAIVTSSGTTICNTSLESKRRSSTSPSQTDLGWELEVDQNTVKRHWFNRPGWQGGARLLLAFEEASQSRWADAARLAEEALLYQGDDALTWWFRAACLEEIGEDAGDELENAHFLAPFEPVLRAEAFLRQKGTQDKDPSPLFSIWKNDPTPFVEVGVRLIEAKLYERAARWLDESWRNRPHALLAFQMAYLHLVYTKMEFEASRWLDLASERPIEPPFPCRELELQMFEELIGGFSEHAALNTWYLLVRRGIPDD